MDDIAKVLIIVLALDALLFLGQVATLNINPNADQFYHYEGSTLQKFDKGNYTLDSSGTANRLPSTAGVSQSGSNLFTDTWSTVKNWLLDTTGLGYLLQILSGPAQLFQIMGAPAELTFAIGAMWYAFTLFLLIAWGLGR